MNVVVCTEYGSNYAEIAGVTTPVMREYCQRHNYQFRELLLEGDGNNYQYKKHEFFSELMGGEDEPEAIFYLDADAMPTNFNYKVEDFITTRHHHLFITKDITEINGGALILRTTLSGYQLNKFILSKRGEFENEQNAINDIYKNDFRGDWIKVLPHPSINSYNYSLYPECQEMVGREDMGDWVEGKSFVLHVPGAPMSVRISALKNAKITR